MKTAVTERLFKAVSRAGTLHTQPCFLTPDDLWHGYTVGFLDGFQHVLIKIFICGCVLQYVSSVTQGSAPLFQFHNAEDLHIGSFFLQIIVPEYSLHRIFWECKGDTHAAVSSRAAAQRVSRLLLNQDRPFGLMKIAIWICFKPSCRYLQSVWEWDVWEVGLQRIFVILISRNLKQSFSTS